MSSGCPQLLTRAMSKVVPPLRPKFERVAGECLIEAKWREIVELCSAAYGEDFEAIFRTLPRTTHVLARVDGRLVSHACWVTRWLQPGDHPPLRTALRRSCRDGPQCPEAGLRQRGDAAARGRDFGIRSRRFVSSLSPHL